MAAKRGLSADIRVDNSGGTLTDISTDTQSVDFSRDAELLDVTAFQAAGGDKEFIVGFKDNKFNIKGRANATIATHLNGIAGQEATVSFQFGPEGTTGGNRKYTGECVMTNYSETCTATGVNEFTAAFQITGAVTVGTY